MKLTPLKAASAQNGDAEHVIVGGPCRPPEQRVGSGAASHGSPRFESANMIANAPRISVVANFIAFAIAAMSCGNVGSQWSPAEQLDDGLGMVSCGGDVAMDADGNAIALWCRHSADYQGSVWTNRFARAEGWGTATRIDEANGSEVLQPSVAMNAAGQAIAVWSKHDPDASRWDVWATTFDPKTGWGNAVLIDESAGNPSVALNNHGRGTLIWTRRDDSSESSIWANSYDPHTGWGSATRVDSEVIVPNQPDQSLDGTDFPAVSSAHHPKVAMNDRGEAVAAWLWTDSFNTSLWTSRYVPDVGWAPSTLLDEPAWTFIPIHLAMDEAGRALAVTSGGNAHSYRPAVGWSLATLHGGISSGGAPNVAMAQNGRAVILWKQEREGRTVELRSSQYSPETGWSTAETVGEADDDVQSYGDWTGSDVMINDRGESLVVWHRERGTYSEELQLPRFSVWANRFEPGRGWGTPTALATSDIANAFDPRLAMDAQGRGMATWQQLEGEHRSIWWSRFE